MELVGRQWGIVVGDEGSKNRRGDWRAIIDEAGLPTTVAIKTVPDDVQLKNLARFGIDPIKHLFDLMTISTLRAGMAL